MKNDGGPAFPSEQTVWRGASLRDCIATAALQGMLASTSGNFAEIRTDPRTGQDTYREQVYPLCNGTEDFSKDPIPCPIRLTREQAVASYAYAFADAMLAERSKP